MSPAPASLDLSLHHVGGRAGSRGFPILPSFEADFINVLYDADPECLPQVEARNDGLASRLHVFPHCFAGSAGIRDFNLNYDPFTSSLLDPNPAFAGYYQFAIGTDYLIGEALKGKERRQVQTVTLDQVYAVPAPPVPPPDVLSLDTQGTELEILGGAGAILDSHVLAVAMEVEFAQLYEGQPLFGATATFMAERGFEFCRFLTLHELYPYRSAIGRRGTGVHAYADALFLRKPAHILAGQEPARASLMLKKLAFVAIVYGLTDLALECRRLDPHPALPEAAPGYLRFQEAWSRLAEVPGEFPPSFAEKFSFARSKGRFDLDAEDTADQRVEETVALLYQHLKQAPPQFSALEALMREHGLTQQAETVWKRRVSQSLYLATLRPGVLAALPPWAGVVAGYLQAWMQEDAGQAEAAALAMTQAASACVQLGPDGITPAVLGYLYAMATVLKRRQVIPPAAAVFTWILRHWSDSAPVMERTAGCCFHLGELALAAGQETQASDWFSQCLGRVPGHRQARIHLDRLQPHPEQVTAR